MAATSGSTQLASQDVGLIFVREYYTFLNKKPHRLHAFYNKDSLFIRGDEGTVTTTYKGQEEIGKKIQECQFEDCKVLVTQVDSQVSANNGILIQVLGEMCNHDGPSQKFSQTFFLATQPNGYFVLNDIFRFLKDEVEIDYYTVDQQQPLVQEPKPTETVVIDITPSPVIHSAVIPEKQEPVVEPVKEEKKQEEKKQEEKKQEEKPVKKEQPKKVTAETSPVAPVEEPKKVEPVKEEPVVAAAVEEKKKPNNNKPVTENKQPQQKKEQKKEVKEPKEPKETKEQKEVKENKPSTPKSWATLASTPAAPVSATASPTPAAATAVAAEKVTPVSPVVTTNEKTQPVQPTQPSQQQPTQQQQNKAQPPRKEATNIFVKLVTEAINEDQLTEAFNKIGSVKSCSISRVRNCAFIEFYSPESCTKALAQHRVQVGSNNHTVLAEERRFTNQNNNNNNRFNNNNNQGRPQINNNNNNQPYERRNNNNNQNNNNNNNRRGNNTPQQQQQQQQRTNNQGGKGRGAPNTNQK